jgi:hypothetical protein
MFKFFNPDSWLFNKGLPATFLKLFYRKEYLYSKFIELFDCYNFLKLDILPNKFLT